ncbi:MAG TPA: hypothetical protein VEY13_01945 [Rubrobacteraceae bacterium]|nr:hypothetical protein [Rubrobacteraceae bacterium]
MGILKHKLTPPINSTSTLRLPEILHMSSLGNGQRSLDQRTAARLLRYAGGSKRSVELGRSFLVAVLFAAPAMVLGQVI